MVKEISVLLPPPGTYRIYCEPFGGAASILLNKPKSKVEVYKAIMNAHLDPYLGYLHSIQFAKPSLVCDIQEIFRDLIEDFLVKYHQNLEPKSFEQKR